MQKPVFVASNVFILTDCRALYHVGVSKSDRFIEFLTPFGGDDHKDYKNTNKHIEAWINRLIVMSRMRRFGFRARHGI